MKLVFVCSAFRGRVSRNTTRAISYCKQIVDEGDVPIAPHLFYPRFLSDVIAIDREAGMKCSLEILSRCDVLYHYGDSTEGMLREIEYAVSLGIPIIERGLDGKQIQEEI